MLVRRVARPMVAGLFVLGGAQGLRDLKPRIEAASRLGVPEPERAAQAHSATMLVGGLGFATGRAPRLCALALAATLVPTTYTEHPFWAAQGAERDQQRVQFLKNISLFGGLLLASVDTEGKDSLARRTRRATRQAKREAKAARLEAALRAERAKRGLERALPS